MAESIDLIQALMLIFIGFLAGGINTIAGGGSNLSLPALMMIGLPADIANATNRVAILMQAVTGAHGYYRHGKLEQTSVKNIFLPIVLGGLIGALSASYLSVELLKPALLITMVIVSCWVVFKSDESPNKNDNILRCTDNKWAFLATFMAGFYGGFVQAGAGFVLIAAFVGVLKYDLLRANALKIVAALLFTIMSLVVFIARDQVAWLAGIYLALGGILGAMLAVKFSVDIKPKTLKILVLLMTIVASVAALFV